MRLARLLLLPLRLGAPGAPRALDERGVIQRKRANTEPAPGPYTVLCRNQISTRSAVLRLGYTLAPTTQVPPNDMWVEPSRYLASGRVREPALARVT